MAEKKQTCFVISPIGEEGTEVRKRADQILKTSSILRWQSAGLTPSGLIRSQSLD
jgi:hypothetical protein